MSRSSKPSPFTSPASLTEKPDLSPAATPLILKPLSPSRLESSNGSKGWRDAGFERVQYWRAVEVA